MLLAVAWIDRKGMLNPSLILENEINATVKGLYVQVDNGTSSAAMVGDHNDADLGYRMLS